MDNDSLARPVCYQNKSDYQVMTPGHSSLRLCLKKCCRTKKGITHSIARANHRRLQQCSASDK